MYKELHNILILLSLVFLQLAPYLGKVPYFNMTKGRLFKLSIRLRSRLKATSRPKPLVAFRGRLFCMKYLDAETVCSILYMWFICLILFTS